MKLSSLLRDAGIEAEVKEAEICAVTDNSEEVVPGSVFVAVNGRKHDGHSNVEEALKKGAVAVVTQETRNVENEIVTQDTRAAYSFLCAAFYGHPERKLKLIGITGTNGKTTTAQYIAHILNGNGKKCGVIGTLGVDLDGVTEHTEHTTPGGNVLFSALAAMVEADCEYCVMEVSSQALDQKRTAALEFEIGVFINIGRDHLDYHGRMNDYVYAKSLLFKQCKKVLFNIDDAYYEQIAEYSGTEKYTSYCIKCGCADFMAKNIRTICGNTEFIFLNGGQAAEIRLDSQCEFSVSNAVAAGAAAVLSGIDFYSAARYMCCLPEIKGRLQKISGLDFDVYIDFAHTPEALMNVLRSLRKNTVGKLICVFGCGGCRDKTKRPEMGRVAEEYADTVILTDDNPRNEDPEQIISDILSGIKKRTGVFIQRDREKAIALAINNACSGDTVVIAGKGHEEYMITASGKSFFSDELTVKRLLNIG